MRTTLVLAAGLVFGLTLATFAGPTRVPTGTTFAPGFAVVELFTSEGCSSCPPADVVLDAVGAAARKEGLRVYPLAFHVDYWDELGWPDPFGSPLASARQRLYSARRGTARVYTPQMLVNGRVEFVGSDADQAKLAITSALATPGTVVLTLEGEAAKGQARWKLEGAPPGLLLNVAVVEKGLSVKVPRGENGGRVLNHDNVVRAFRGVPLAAETEGAVELPVPADAKKENLKMIAYLQDPESMAVLAAADI